MVNAYVYPPGTGSGQAAQQGPAVPTTTPTYSSYQPTPTQGYQASGAGWGEGWGNAPRLSGEISAREGERTIWSQPSGCAAAFPGGRVGV